VAPPPSFQPAASPNPVTPPSSFQPAASPNPVAPPTGINLDTVQAGRFDFGKMWTFEFPPVDYFRDEYGFTPDSAWFDRARLGALRLPNCSASFVSPNGLVMTNHHCVRDGVAEVSRPGEDLIDNGFFAKTLADERVLEDVHVDQLIEILDVTDEVEARLRGVSDEDRFDTQEDAFSEVQDRIVEERGGEAAGINVEVISLFAGGHYSAYVFRRYSNLKLVVAPELQIGFYGGDPDNFTYPRYNLDFSFLRVYDDEGHPLQTDDYFKLDDDGLEPGDPVFVVGNPGSTSRLQTVAELEFRRDVSDKGVLEFVNRRIDVLQAFADAQPAAADRMDLVNTIFSLQNTQKAYRGQLKGLADPVIITKRTRSQEELQDSLGQPGRASEYGGLIERLAELQQTKRAQATGYGSFLGLTSEDYEAPTLSRALLAVQVMNASRGGNPGAASGVRTRFRAIDDMPAELDIALMAARFQEWATSYGQETPWVQSILQGRTAEEAARSIHAGSLMADSATAVAAVDSGNLDPSDPAIAVVIAYIPPFSAFQQVLGRVSPEEERIAAKLGRARMELYGTSHVPPDATFSLRIADGVVTGFPYNGTIAPPFTTLYGLYDRHYSFEAQYPDSSESPWALPERWLPVPADLDLTKEVDFVFTADIIGGNSGSPVLDRDLEVVGLVFDGNMESLPGDYIYLPELNRAVAVDVRGIVEALAKVYNMDGLVWELRTGQIVR
jgi:hypothetical protein